MHIRCGIPSVDEMDFGSFVGDDLPGVPFPVRRRNRGLCPNGTNIEPSFFGSPKASTPTK